MSERDMDALPRMRDYLRPEDLNLDGCLALAAAVLEGAADALTDAARQAAEYPESALCQEHFRAARAFYTSDLFTALSCGVAESGDEVARAIIRRALRGAKL